MRARKALADPGGSQRRHRWREQRSVATFARRAQLRRTADPQCSVQPVQLVGRQCARRSPDLFGCAGCSVWGSSLEACGREWRRQTRVAAGSPACSATVSTLAAAANDGALPASPGASAA
jgi:hypothetical protein